MNKYQGNGAGELDKAIATFGETLRGPLIGRQHPEYEDTRKLYNGMIDTWPPHRHPRRRPQRTWAGELQ